MSIVANAGPLIALGRVGELNLLPLLYQDIIVPPGVYQEVTRNTTLPSALEILQASWVKIEQIVNTTEVQRLRYWLDVGESEAIVLAQTKILPLLIDEQRGRSIAFALNIVHTGTVGVLLAAKREGYIKEVTPFLHKLQSVGVYLSPHLCETVRHMAGE